MIVVMMDLVNKNPMKKTINFFSIRLLGSLILFILVLSVTSCKKKTKIESKLEQKLETEHQYQVSNNQSSINDSITISVKINGRGKTGFNIKDKYLHYYYLEFVNKSMTDTTIFKTIPKYHKTQIINIGGIKLNNGKSEFYEHYFFIDSTDNKLNFNYQNGMMRLENSNDFIYVDSLHKKYNDLSIELKKTNKKIDKKLYELHQNLNKRYIKENNSHLVNLNEIYYLDLLQRIDTLNNKIDAYLKEDRIKIICNPISSILFHYTKNKIHKLNFAKLDTATYSDTYIEFISIGVFNFLRYEENKGDKQYQAAINWLKTTDLYKKDSIYIKKEITPLNNIGFKNKLKSLILLDVSLNKTSFSEMLKKNPSDYYLIDFWATWCAPCIKGINSMGKMKFPKNVKIISLSLDKINVKDKWKSKTKELAQKISFLVDEKNQKNKEFLKFIELQSVPRYILIDKNMNLIDEAFLQPNELQFLSKLKDVKNHKYW